MTPDKQVLGNRVYKFKHVIAPLLEKKQPSLVDELAQASGKGLAPQGFCKTASNYLVEYMYYNNIPKQLKQQLKLILVEIQAGNNNLLLLNEMASIWKELYQY